MIRRGIKREGRRKRGKKELSTSYIYIQDWSVGDFPYNNLLPMEEEEGGGEKGLTHLLPLCSWNALVREGVRVRGDSKLENYRRSINRRDSLNVLIHGYVASETARFRRSPLDDVWTCLRVWFSARMTKVDWPTPGKLTWLPFLLRS